MKLFLFPATLAFSAIGLAADIITLDNTAPQGVETKGAWRASTLGQDYYSGDFCHDQKTGKGKKTAIYTPAFPAPGRYHVQMTWPAGANRATNVPVDIFHKGGMTTVAINQQKNGGMWNHLGTFDFSASGDGRVRIRTDGTDGFYVCADAVRFVKAGSRSVFDMEFKQIATNQSSTCRRSFGAGLYDRDANKTFVCWNGPGMSVYVRAYDHTAGEWEEEKEVCHLDYRKQWDYHDYPVMRLAPDGRLVVYFCDHTRKLYQAKAPIPHSAGGEWGKTEISDDQTTYPMPLVAGGEIYVFYSKNDEITWPHRTYRYIKSGDNGDTWSRPVTIIDSERQDPGKYDEVYAWGMAHDAEGKRIGITWTMGGGVSHYSASKDLYFACLDIASGKMKNAAGTDLGKTIGYAALASCRVVTAQGDPHASGKKSGLKYPVSRPMPSFDGGTGRPVVAFGLRDADGAEAVSLAKWDGGEWQTTVITPRTASLYDFERNGEKTCRLIYRQGATAVVCRSTDGGATWDICASARIPFGEGFDRLPEMQFIENGRPDVMAFMGLQFNDSDKPGGYNYDGVFKAYIVKEKEF